MEQFYTIQGEGTFAGQAAYFIRLAGCDVGCTWCDVKESWDATQHSVMEVEALVAEATQHPARLVVITGGEPLMYPLGPLTLALKSAGLRTHIETSGAHPLSGSWDWICLSPKKFKLPLPAIYAQAQELKIIAFNQHDLEWAHQQADQVEATCLLIIQPEWSRAEQMMPLIVDFVKQHPRWRISLQTHKYMNVP